MFAPHRMFTNRSSVDTAPAGPKAGCCTPLRSDGAVFDTLSRPVLVRVEMAILPENPPRSGGSLRP